MGSVVVNVGSLGCKSLEGPPRIIGEVQGDGVSELALRTNIAFSESVRAQLDLLQRKRP